MHMIFAMEMAPITVAKNYARKTVCNNYGVIDSCCVLLPRVGDVKQ